MAIRKNAKFLNATERENLVKALVLMKADIVNPMAPAADRYSRWDEAVAVHHFIQNANTPAASNVNFGHGGLGAYGFLTWHRYFLYLLEKQLQTYVPGVTIPYWDWTDPVGTIMVADFLGPNGDAASAGEVRQGYFAKEAPGTGANLTPAPAWWPAGLTGWLLHAAFGTSAGALKRQIGAAAALPSAATLRSALAMGGYSLFQNALESGSGTVPFHQLHNGLHGWFGTFGTAHMASVVVSPFDPMFYLHHCNADRLWAMWQMDGHATEYPALGAKPGHAPTDPMYPWVGALAGYSTNFSHPPIVMPDFTALGIIEPTDVLDHRALGYSYDTQAVIGVALDRTGSMTALTPDPMTTGAPDVTKWEAAKRGVAAFFQDCEAAYQSAETYVVSGVKTFRRLAANDFAPVFGGPGYGLIKGGGAFSSVTFSASAAGMSPGGSTPLADALTDLRATVVAPPFGWLPAGERRYIAFFTDGILTSGSPMSSIPDGSLADTAVFAMGFGTGVDVDYGTLASLVAKGQTLTTPQVFHGENAGVIDKFYSQALAAAIGFTPISDPVLELFEGEHTHYEFTATSAEEAFFITAQGMDFQDSDWSYQLIGPAGDVVYSDGSLPAHSHGGGHAGGRQPDVTARRGQGRLSLFLKRDSADASLWVGTWTLMIAWRARSLDGMMMPSLAELMFPVAAGPVRGPRYARLNMKPEQRKATRAVPSLPRHRLDVLPASTNRSGLSACSVVVNVYARTRLKIGLHPATKGFVKEAVSISIESETLRGRASTTRGFARLAAPAIDLAAVIAKTKFSDTLLRAAAVRDPDGLKFDSAILLAKLESRDARLGRIRDEELKVVTHHQDDPHVHIEKTDIPGVYNVGIWVEGVYDPQTPARDHMSGGHTSPAAGSTAEYFNRLLTASVALRPKAKPKRSAGRR